MARLSAAWLVAALLGAGCGSRPAPVTVTLATTTSTQDSGLLDVLVPLARPRAGVEVRVVAVGTGQALELGRRGDADVLLVHDPAGEEKFMAEGHGELRRPVFYNDFVVVGPPADPAGVRGCGSAAEVFRRLAARQTPFISRADGSGTHRKEQALWRLAGVEPAGDWYARAGAGMAQVLRMAAEKRAYALTDRATFLAQRRGPDLEALAEGDRPLVNQYSEIVVRADKHAPARHAAAVGFADFLSSAEGKEAVAAYGADRFGEPLFFVGVPPDRPARPAGIPGGLGEPRGGRP
jgi:tungstate transport system substrate-binding protein